ncbi:MAG: phosphoribosylformylglycinamidine synthase subunit PurL [Candidatus ainarchaeum sp.]|nr:phosphoribosylformylglycinamidine synthase subunit PurL [Candidatus ainarchaeum sp.]
MAERIYVGFREGVTDAAGNAVLRRVKDDFGFPAASVRTVDVYTFDCALSPQELERLAGGLFADPVVQVFSVGKPLAAGFDWIVEVGFKPGVTDNAGKTSREAAEEMLGRKLGGDVYTSRQYLFRGGMTRGQVESVSSRLLANDLIERRMISDAASWNPESGFGLIVPKVVLAHEPEVGEVDLKVRNKTLLKISSERLLALDLREMKAIQKHFRDPVVREGRAKLGLPANPTDVEIECLAQTWSEHCKHKIFNAAIRYDDGSGKARRINSLFRSCIRKSTERTAKKVDWLVSVFVDNAGVFRFNDSWNLAMKVETHNAPSALDPYGGALTGIVGVNRDVMGTGRGARLVANTDVFCFADPAWKKEVPPRLHHPKRVFEGVRRGVEHGGNKLGIPTVNGSIVFDDRYLGRPLVYCGTVGIMPSAVCGADSSEKTVKPGDLAVMVGGRVGRDGIHGATFSSQELNEVSPVTAVQLGDPITQKRMMDFLLEARDLCMFKALTDNGAGGLSSSVGEMAQLSGGCEIMLDAPPLKYAGLNPWEILVSESQERMTVAVSPEKFGEFKALADRRGVECTAVGKFTDSGDFVCTYGGKTVAFIPMKFLHGGVPQMKLSARWEERRNPEPEMPDEQDQTQNLSALLSRLNVCSKEYVVRQYDHEVQGGSAVKPLMGAQNDGPSDAAVVRPLLESGEGVVVSHGICPRYSDIDAYWMAACAVDEALRNYVATGGSLSRVACLDNFCWCDPVKSEKTPDGEFKLAQLVRANKALYDFTVAYRMPPISGKDSMKNDYVVGGVKISIPPTLLISAVGKIGDVYKAVTVDAKKAGDLVYVLGVTRSELGGSEYYAMKGFVGNSVPKVDAKAAYKLYRALEKAVSRGLLASCHDCSDGGLGVALAETAFSGMLGMQLDLRLVPREGAERNDSLLFSESQSRFVATVSPENAQKFEKAMKGNQFARIGEVNGSMRLVAKGLNGANAIDADIAELKKAWKRTLGW